MYMFIMPQFFFFKNVGIFNVAKFLIELMKDIILSCYFGVKKGGNFKWKYDYFNLSDQ